MLTSLYLTCQLYIEPGDVILVESPTFVHAVQTFKMFQARCIACESAFVLRVPLLSSPKSF